MMFKLVVCNTHYYAWDADALKRAKAATKRGNKNKWKYNLPGNIIFLQTISRTVGKEFTFLSWHGSEDAYLLFRLTENTGLVAGQMNVDTTGEVWLDILKHFSNFRIAFEERKNLASWEKIDALNLEFDRIQLAYRKLLKPINICFNIGEITT